ncbi:unnamed protein product [Nesidiocoris tenuis]|uniref:Uncharacterized protein n=1 Tax=Nesidiocoris tenuis TaxID=355587 RepID=A0A6H5GVM5_9HEMI|nr:unnamed protein product [Nesidiocoris tenuis]
MDARSRAYRISTLLLRILSQHPETRLPPVCSPSPTYLLPRGPPITTSGSLSTKSFIIVANMELLEIGHGKFCSWKIPKTSICRRSGLIYYISTGRLHSYQVPLGREGTQRVNYCCYSRTRRNADSPPQPWIPCSLPRQSSQRMNERPCSRCPSTGRYRQRRYAPPPPPLSSLRHELSFAVDSAKVEKVRGSNNYKGNFQGEERKRKKIRQRCGGVGLRSVNRGRRTTELVGSVGDQVISRSPRLTEHRWSCFRRKCWRHERTAVRMASRKSFYSPATRPGPRAQRCLGDDRLRKASVRTGTRRTDNVGPLF